MAICTICTSPRLGDVDASLRAPGMSQRRVAKLYGLNRGAVQRHAQNHLDQATAASPASTAPSGSDAASQLRAQLGQLDADLVTTTSVAARVDVQRERRLTLEALGRLEGPPRPAVVDIFEDETFLAFMGWLLEHVERHDDAHQHEGGVAGDSLRMDIIRYAAERMEPDASAVAS